jgi:hypothetical protein
MKQGIAAKPRRGRFIAPIADLSAPADTLIHWLNFIIGPRGLPEDVVTSHNRPLRPWQD